MVYLDGSVETTEPICTNDLNVFVGDNPEATGCYWDDLIDEVFIYKRSLSRDETLFIT